MIAVIKHLLLKKPSSDNVDTGDTDDGTDSQPDDVGGGDNSNPDDVGTG